MKKLLENYLKIVDKTEYVYIWNWYIDGATCFVEYYNDEARYNKKIKKINIWDVVSLLNNLI